MLFIGRMVPLGLVKVCNPYHCVLTFFSNEYNSVSPNKALKGGRGGMSSLTPCAPQVIFLYYSLCEKRKIEHNFLFFQ